MTLQIPDEAARNLRSLVARHMVVFEARPAYQMVEGHRAAIGYDVELAGTHSEAVLHGEEPAPWPGCERCIAVFADLEQIANAVLPPSDRPSRYEVGRFRPSLSYDRKRQSPRVVRPDVILTIEIRHREGFLEPTDPCEDHCLSDITRALRSLGVQEGTWSSAKARYFERQVEEHQDVGASEPR